MEEPLRERLGDWIAGIGRGQLVALVVAGLVTLGGAGLWYVRALPKPVRVVAEAGPSPGASASASPADIVVHVAGWVRRPGVYSLPLGSRVVDAIELAGGAKAGADLSALNLASLLVDAQQVLVPRAGAGGGGGPGGGGGGGPGGPGGGGGSDGGLVNLNTATLEQLETLPGIGPVLAQKILDYRTEHGPFTAVEQLMDVSGIGEARYEELKDKVTI